ncbi:discoidin domain-containing protein [Dictyobacter kobayashii]|uniref:F5/8 type C domain-containing protein n=1 Tax=Dictyobacter kobayashii TaxID=2014872 RepID=A0A402ATE4_9CHLR|nr:discoidin domain-containing protein [Dictyobacter kobayashii]GCE22364.1 hypothetical protein KDK_61640 [Dictyobacter kobayashii]
MGKKQQMLRWMMVVGAVIATISLSLSYVLFTGVQTAEARAKPSSNNLVLNPGFESGLTNWLDAGGDPQTNTQVVHSGTQALQLGPAQQARTQTVTLQPNTLYTLTGWGKLIGSHDYSQISLLVTDNTGQLYGYQMHFSDVDWTWQGQTVLTPSTIKSALIFIQKNAGTGTFYADDISLVAGRNPLVWPYEANSIWNTPIGSNAVYKSTYIQKAANVSFDPVFFSNLQGAVDYSTYPLYSPDGPSYTVGGVTYGGRCKGTTNYGTIKLPDNLVVGDATLAPNYSTPNNAAGIVQPDGRTVVQIQPLARCDANGPANGYRGTESDLYGDGILGTHFGSGMNVLGGLIRQSELVNATPIMHSLQLEVWGRKYFAYNQSDPQPGFRWPAANPDGYAKDPNYGYCTLDPCKSNPDTSFRQGSLMALNPSLTPQSLGLTSAPAIKLFYALQHYGGYVVDDTGWDDNQIGIDNSALADTNLADATFVNDVNTLFANLQIIDNNSPNSIGGGGTPLVKPAPAIHAKTLTPLSKTGWSATASDNSADASLALDGNVLTGWNTGKVPYAGENIVIDMKKPRTFNRVDMDSSLYPFAHVQDYDIYVSDDGVNWSSLVTHGSASRTSQITFDTQTARYIKIQSTGGSINPSQIWAVDEINVFNVKTL